MPTDSRLVELRTALVDDFKTFLPDMRSVEAHFGPFDIDELKAFSLKAPAVRVSILGGPMTPVSTREQEVRLQIAAYIVTSSTAALPADVAALAIGEAIVERLSGRSFTRWSTPAQDLRLDNHYSGALREKGAIALFSVSWQSQIVIGRNVARERCELAPRPGQTPDPTEETTTP